MFITHLGFGALFITYLSTSLCLTSIPRTAAAAKPSIHLRSSPSSAEMSTRDTVDDTWDGIMSPTGLQLAKLLRGLNDGENPLPAFVHKANAYSAAPQDLIKGRRLAPGMSHGMQGSCYFHSYAAPVKQGRRNRKVPGGSWHSEKTERWDFEKEMHLGCVVYKRTFSYIVKCPSGMKRHRGRQRTGWIMAEISLDEHGNGADNMVLCVVHKSTHNYADTSMAPGSSAGEGAAPGRNEEASVHVSPGLKCATAEKAARTTDKCGLHKPGSLGELEELQHDAIIKEPTPNGRDGVVYCGDDMWSTISTAYLNIPWKKLQQELNDLGDPVTEGAENELPVDSSGSGVKRKADDRKHPEAAPGVRQEIVDTDSTSFVEEIEHAALPAGNNPMPIEELADTDHFALQETIQTHHRLASDNNDPMLDEGDQDWNLNNILELEDIINVELTLVGADDSSADSARFIAAGMPRIAEEYQQEPTGDVDGYWGDLLFSFDGALGGDESPLAEASELQL